jgi:vacuolar-type H+-ATPase subunit E/Vma4
MDSEEKGKAALIASIESDAKAEIEKILSEAKVQAQEKRRYAEKKIQSIISEAKEKGDEQAQNLKRRMLCDVENEIKRIFLQEKEQVMQKVVGLAKERLRSMIDEPECRNVLKDWIVEAAIGLGAQGAKINASEKERALIDESLIKEVESTIKSKSGKEVKLRLAQDKPLEGQGVVVTADDGRVAFNNQVKTRLSRSERKIRMMIYDTLFSDTKEAGQ